MGFKYKYEHLDCNLCVETDKGGCGYEICPHIMDNLDDLRHDPEFTEAVRGAVHCKSSHRAALMLLKASGFRGRKPSPQFVREKPDYGVKPECASCPYPNHGFVCHRADSSCLKTDMDKYADRRRASCPV